MKKNRTLFYQYKCSNEEMNIQFEKRRMNVIKLKKKLKIVTELVKVKEGEGEKAFHKMEKGNPKFN